MPDVFICHASEDKEAVAIPLAQALVDRGLSVWLDEWELTVGDSLLEAIDQGLAASTFGVVIISPDFFRKRWPRRELDGLATRELAAGGKVILPVWHKVTRQDVLQHSPPLADRLAASTDGEAIEAVADKLLRAVRKGTGSGGRGAPGHEQRQSTRPPEVGGALETMESERERLASEIQSLIGDGVDDNIALPWVRARRTKEARLAALDKRLKELRSLGTGGPHRCYRCKALMTAEQWLDGQCRECGYINEID